MSPEEDPLHLPTLKIPCKVVRNPTYFTKYLPDHELNQRRAAPTPVDPPPPQLPSLHIKGVKNPNAAKKPLRYDTAYGNAFVLKQLVDNQLHLNDVTDVLEQRFSNEYSLNDFYTYKPRLKREYVLWEPKKDVKYFQGDIDKRLVEAKQRINKSWRKELKAFFKKEKKTEEVVLRRANKIDKGLMAYLKNVEKDVQKYEKDEKLTKLRKKMAKETKGSKAIGKLPEIHKRKESIRPTDKSDPVLKLPNL